MNDVEWKEPGWERWRFSSGSHVSTHKRNDHFEIKRLGQYVFSLNSMLWCCSLWYFVINFQVCFQNVYNFNYKLFCQICLTGPGLPSISSVQSSPVYSYTLLVFQVCDLSLGYCWRSCKKLFYISKVALITIIMW